MKRKKIFPVRIKHLILFLIGLLISPGIVFAELRLPALISDGMVLQRNMEICIWGWAEPGELITVTGSWQNEELIATADMDGQWLLKMEPHEAGGPYKLTISNEESITINNIMFGEVWICSGQSNMKLSVIRAANAAREITEADYPDIRMFKVVNNVAEEPQTNCRGDWAVCSPETVPQFSAVGYYFARELHKELGVPIGMIHSSWGGTPAEAWTKEEVLEEIPECAPILQRYEEAVKNFPRSQKEYENKLQEWERSSGKAKSEETWLLLKPQPPYGPGHPHSPSGLYNGMISPLIRYRIKGVIWYQGENNTYRAYQYRKLFPAMIRNWRSDWEQGDFPFLFVQLPNYMAVNSEPVESYWAELREAQLKTLHLPNTGMAVTIDIGEIDDIHPKNKQDVGKRLALWALAKSYGKDLVYSGPVYKSMDIEGGRIILHFEHIGGGLTIPGNEKLKGFTIAGEDRRFVWADAEIDGDTVVVSNESIVNPVAVRYGWADNPQCNLYNKEGLPASPFRTDDWPGITNDRK